MRNVGATRVKQGVCREKCASASRTCGGGRELLGARRESTSPQRIVRDGEGNCALVWRVQIRRAERATLYRHKRESPAVRPAVSGHWESAGTKREASKFANGQVRVIHRGENARFFGEVARAVVFVGDSPTSTRIPKQELFNRGLRGWKRMKPQFNAAIHFPAPELCGLQPNHRSPSLHPRNPWFNFRVRVERVLKLFVRASRPDLVPSP